MENIHKNIEYHHLISADRYLRTLRRVAMTRNDVTLHRTEQINIEYRIEVYLQFEMTIQDAHTHTENMPESLALIRDMY